MRDLIMNFDVPDDERVLETYKLYKSDYIIENQKEIVRVADICHSALLDDGFSDTTWSYYLYNIFMVATPSVYFLEIYKTLISIIKENIPDQQVYLQAWLNFHNYDEVLDWHDHSAPYHGYISIEPQDTTTEFTDWEIKNECGNIYFGRGNISHRVVNNSKYTGKRITIGYDVVPATCFPGDIPANNHGLIPIL